MNWLFNKCLSNYEILLFPGEHYHFTLYFYNKQNNKNLKLNQDG